MSLLGAVCGDLDIRRLTGCSRRHGDEKQQAADGALLGPEQQADVRLPFGLVWRHPPRTRGSMLPGGSAIGRVADGGRTAVASGPRPRLSRLVTSPWQPVGGRSLARHRTSPLRARPPRGMPMLAAR
ncbi:hypothetical protein GCM10010095_21390 [Streptomyces anthocyanicus]|nr:hypothetical protein GCM10010095_21390 [Streptomyces anthocyanicus]